RDVVSADVRLQRGIVKLLDVAGLEPVEPRAEDVSAQAHIARQARQRAMQMVEASDLVVLVRDPGGPSDTPELPRPPDLVVHTKLDRPDGVAGVVTSGDHVSISAHTGANLDLLRSRLDALAFGANERPSLALNARHLAALAAARAALARARANAPTSGPEIVALDLREALDALGTILGQVSPDDVLGRVFATFCIGK
ncbi:MAG: hypothetical protein WBD40_11065, partial [Tepidisphaeraceae bacterium]